MPLSGIKALAFDTGGTVLDWHTGIRAALAQAGARHGVERDWTAITNAYRRRALQRMTNQTTPGFNIDDVHRTVLDELASEHGLGMFSEADRAAIAATLALAGCLAGLSRRAGAPARTIHRGVVHHPQRLADHRYRASQRPALGCGDLLRDAGRVQAAAGSLSAGGQAAATRAQTTS